MTLIGSLLGIAVAIVTLAAVFLKVAYQLGQMTQQLNDLNKKAEEATSQIKELFDWRYTQSAVQSAKGRGKLPRN